MQKATGSIYSLDHHDHRQEYIKVPLTVFPSHLSVVSETPFWLSAHVSVLGISGHVLEVAGDQLY